MLSTSLFDRPAFLNCISHGIVLGNDGRKASKSLRNYPDPLEMFDQYGSDAVRWTLMSSPVLRGGNLVVAEESIRDSARTVLLPLWNTWYFLALYAGTVDGGAGYQAKILDLADADQLASLEVMDRYLLARTRTLAADVAVLLDENDIPAACNRIRDFLDVVTNWYVRTQRDRFWDEDRSAFDTLATVLDVVTRVAAPLAPMVSEEIWRGLTGGRSVHLTDWPVLPDAVADDALVTAMDEVRAVVSAAHGLRKANKLRVRLPLASLRVVLSDPESLAPFTELIASEVNVKSVELASAAESGLAVRRELTILPRELDPGVRRFTSQLFAAQRSGEWEEQGEGIAFPGIVLDGAPVVLSPGQFELTTAVDAEEGSAADVLASGAFVVLDTVVTHELEAEGYARDVVRFVQDARKEADLHVADRIRVALAVPAENLTWVETHREMVARECLIVELTLAEGETLAVTSIEVAS